MGAVATAPAGGGLAALPEVYAAYLADTGRGNVLYERHAQRFFARWPDPHGWAGQPLSARLAANPHVRPLLTFLMLHGWLRPGYDYLVGRKLTPLWRELPHSPLADDLARFVTAAVEADPDLIVDAMERVRRRQCEVSQRRSPNSNDVRSRLP